MNYSPQVQEHFMHPKNQGELARPDGVGEVGNPTCGDIMKMTIQVEPKTKTIKAIKFKTFGCAAAIATSSVVTELAKGKTLAEAKQITQRDVTHSLGELPHIKLHCAHMATDALRAAIADYENHDGSNK